MHLQRGTRLGPYEVVSPIGQGGMGEVYRGLDTRLGRPVAIKILPERLASRADLRARFDREARAVSQLNHRHICTLHDVGEAVVDGSSVLYFVMELLEGETLADVLARGLIPLDQALRYAMEIADGLDRAHRSGIVHRDLKPGNIMITPAGVKLLDFGLAKSVAPVSVDSDSPTVQSVTADNVFVGTLQYMSPEQLTGGVVDARSDIFAFGAVLYEMVTGRRAFSGATQASIIAGIVHDDVPRVSALRPVTPAALDRIIAMCMAKDPEERWQNARDVMLQLRAVASADVVPAVVQNRTRALPLIAAAVAGMMIGALAVYSLSRSAPAVTHRPKHVSLDVIPPLPLQPNGFGAPFDIAADASQIAWVGWEKTVTALFVRRLDALGNKRIPGSEQAVAPFFSRDGESIGFFGRGRLWVASLRGDAPVRAVCASGPGAGGTWLDDQTLVFAPVPGGGLRRVSLANRKVDTVTVVDGANGEAGHSWPFAIPGTRSILFAIERDGRPWDEAQIAAYSFDTQKKRVVLDGGTRPRYAGGKLFFARQNQLFAVRFDPQKLEVIGSPAVVVDGVVAQPGTGGSFYAVAADGTVAYLRGGEDFFTTRVVARSPDGNAVPLELPLKTFANPRLSHDGKHVALQVVSANDDVWIYDRERRTFTRVTAEAENLFPNWSPDDKSFLVSMFFSGDLPLVVNMPIARSTEPRPLAPDIRAVQIGTSWSASGRIALSVLSGSGFDLYVIDRLGAPARPLLKTPFNEHEATLSPDGRFIAYTSDESGAGEIYVRDVDRPADKLQLSISGGHEPLWSRDGRRVYFREGERFMAVDITIAGSTPRAGTPIRLFEGDYVDGSEANAYDVGADGIFMLLQRNGSAQDGARLQLLFPQ